MKSENQVKKTVSIPGTYYTIAKYFVVLLMAAFVIVIILSNRSKNIPFEQVKEAVEQAIDKETMHDAGSKGFRRFYNLNDAEYDGILMYQSVSGMSAEEILLVKVNNNKQLDSLTEAIEQRRESRVNDFSGYAPQEAALMEGAELIVKGNYVLFLPYSNAAEVKQAFLTALGE